MEISPTLIIVMAGTVGGMLIERFFYYRMKYKDKKKPVCVPANPGDTENPSHGERLMGLEKDVENLKENNEKDHRLIRGDIKKIFTLLNGIRRPGK